MGVTQHIKDAIDYLHEDNAQSLEELFEWRKRLRDAVDAVVIARIEPAFNLELRRKLGESGESAEKSKNLCTTMNFLLRENQLCILNSSGAPSSLVFSRSRESDRGRVYVGAHTSAPQTGRHRERFDAITSNDLKLAALQISQHPLGKFYER